MEQNRCYLVTKEFNASGIWCKVGYVIQCSSSTGTGRYNVLITEKCIGVSNFVSTGITRGYYNDYFRELYKNEYKFVKGKRYGK